MHLLYCDESNYDKRNGDFLVYAGVGVMSEQVAALSKAMDRLRDEFGLRAHVRLKFNERAEGMPQDEFVVLKKKIFEQMAKHDVGLFAYVILHDIARHPDEARRNGINTVAYNFDSYLDRVREAGMVFIDRFLDKDKAFVHHLDEKFSKGCKFENGETKRLTNIVGFHYVSVGQSHFATLSDMAASALRYALNVHTRAEEKNLPIAKALLKQLEPLFIREGDRPISEKSFVFSPKTVKFGGYLEKYKSLQKYLAENGVDTAQVLTGSPSRGGGFRV
jgi:hypothetical protein